MKRDCDLCGSSDRTRLPQDLRIAVCMSCGFVYVPERRTSAEIAEAWGAVYGADYNPEWPGVKARLYYVAEWIDRHIGLNGKTLLDIGAGQGQFLRLARERGAIVQGLEPSYDNMMICVVGVGHGLNTMTLGTVERAGPILPVDIVTINWTLENCGDCIAMLEYAAEHLTPGGSVVVATGSRILVPFKKPLSSYLNPKLPADLHCFRWSAASLTRALGETGLGVIIMNDFLQRDELVVVASPERPREFIVLDDPAAVLRHFAEWARLFP